MENKKDLGKVLSGILMEQKIGYLKIMLFGSRAKGKDGNDWDFFIILKKPLTINQKKRILFNIYKTIHEQFPYISVDIILKDIKSFENEKKIVNTISNEVYLEGVEI